MPKFVYSIGFLILLLNAGMFKLISNLNPAVVYAKPLFLILFFGIVFLTTSLIVLFVNTKRQSFYTDTRTIYRKGLKVSFFYGLAISGLVGLKTYSLLTPITGLLLLAFIFSLTKLFSGNRR